MHCRDGIADDGLAQRASPTRNNVRGKLLGEPLPRGRSALLRLPVPRRRRRRRRLVALLHERRHLRLRVLVRLHARRQRVLAGRRLRAVAVFEPVLEAVVGGAARQALGVHLRGGQLPLHLAPRLLARARLRVLDLLQRHLGRRHRRAQVVLELLRRRRRLGRRRRPLAAPDGAAPLRALSALSLAGRARGLHLRLRHSNVLPGSAGSLDSLVRRLP
mmetsp:Transcript_4135/g.10625  ORF Transcript_4135/g.10625 Transcript_4135/m.10625 type:complete len:217 (-) Transcript_4135:21-671(-)